MDIIRLFFLALAQILFAAVNESPTEGKEMGEIPDDKVYPGGRMDRTYKSRIIFGVIFAWFTFSNIYRYGDVPLTYLEWFVCLMMVTSAALRLYCYWTLGSMFTFKLGIRADHELIQTGPYKYLIHPSYTGQILFMSSYMCFHGINIILIGCLTAYVIYRLRTRMANEESMMEMKFGPKYKEYINKHWRLLPYIY
ncbi:Isoprenylcysteine carboxyl methyltransferase [uncultured virus]|nr:Isoprenylcysteine carboxyl methyltransferase [uncultured virus]